MTRHRWSAFAGLLLVVLLGACGGQAREKVAGGGARAAAPVFHDTTTMYRLQKKGKLVVGVKFDQPLFGLKAPSGRVEGFDVEIAKLIAEGIYGKGNTDGVIEFVETPSKIRESAIADGKVDLVVATYTITDQRKQQVDFAGPYYVAGQDIMTRKDDLTINGIDDLNDRKVCSVEGSTSLKTIQERAPRARLLAFATYSLCAGALYDGRVDAVSTDNVILMGIIDQQPGFYRLVGRPFTQEPYGIGLKKDDFFFRAFLNDRLAEIFKSGEWKAAYDRTVGKVAGPAPPPPELQRY